jgi:hypothetical protein
MGDLRGFTCDLMQQLESDLGTHARRKNNVQTIT